MAIEIVGFAVAAVAGAMASIAGFGIGSLLTPLLAFIVGDMRVAVAAVGIPHVVAALVRFWQLHRDVDWRVFRRFGLASAIGGLLGAALHSRLSSIVLTRILAGLLLVAGAKEVTGKPFRLSERLALVAGVISGIFGGLVGNQGGVRSAALIGLELQKHAIVATATAIALVVDAVRLPIYVATEGARMAAMPRLITVLTVGVIVGTLAGHAVLRRLPDAVFRKTVGVLLIGLAIYLGAQTM